MRNLITIENNKKNVRSRGIISLLPIHFPNTFDFNLRELILSCAYPNIGKVGG
jgi:hypothetical protein